MERKEVYSNDYMSLFDTCYELLLELKSILIQEGEDFSVSIAVYYEKYDD